MSVQWCVEKLLFNDEDHVREFVATLGLRLGEGEGPQGREVYVECPKVWLLLVGRALCSGCGSCESARTYSCG